MTLQNLLIVVTKIKYIIFCSANSYNKVICIYQFYTTVKKVFHWNWDFMQYALVYISNVLQTPFVVEHVSIKSEFQSYHVVFTTSIPNLVHFTHFAHCSTSFCFNNFTKTTFFFTLSCETWPFCIICQCSRQNVNTRIDCSIRDIIKFVIYLLWI